jgi:hypothetical protein
MDTINKTYTAGMDQVGGTALKFRTDPQQAVFVCLNDNPPTIQLLCACNSKCLDEKSTNNIAHCDKPCLQSCNGQASPGPSPAPVGSASSSLAALPVATGAAATGPVASGGVPVPAKLG